MTSRLRLCNAYFGSAHRLVRKPLQPQHPRQEHAGRHAQISPEANDVLKANDIPRWIGSSVMSQHVLQMRPSTDLIAKKMLGRAHRPLAEQPIIQVGPVHCQIVELLREWQRSTVSTAPGVIEIQAPESAQLVLGVAKALRDIEHLGERCAHLGNIGRRRAQRSVQPHLLA